MASPALRASVRHAEGNSPLGVALSGLSARGVSDRGEHQDCSGRSPGTRFAVQSHRSIQLLSGEAASLPLLSECLKPQNVLRNTGPASGTPRFLRVESACCPPPAHGLFPSRPAIL